MTPRTFQQLCIFKEDTLLLKNAQAENKNQSCVVIVSVGHQFCRPALVFRRLVLEDFQICHCFPSCIGFVLSDPITRRPAYWAQGQPSGRAQWSKLVLALSAKASWVVVKLRM